MAGAGCKKSEARPMDDIEWEFTAECWTRDLPDLQDVIELAREMSDLDSNEGMKTPNEQFYKVVEWMKEQFKKAGKKVIEMKEKGCGLDDLKGECRFWAEGCFIPVLELHGCRIPPINAYQYMIWEIISDGDCNDKEYEMLDRVIRKMYMNRMVKRDWSAV